jgi:hypothetical protein
MATVGVVEGSFIGEEEYELRGSFSGLIASIKYEAIPGSHGGIPKGGTGPTPM